jgi:3-hydroxy acid dehydrogenase/malonic semialdehyde reductase
VNFKKAVITGASSGIGRAIALALAKKGVNLVLVARREDRLTQLKAEIGSSVRVDTKALDIRERESVIRFAESLVGVEVLINNAGLAKGIDRVQEARVEDWDSMIDTNVKGLLYFTRALLPSMIQAGSGHIVNLGSVAGRWVYPGGAVYCASKFAVSALSEGLRMDLLGTGVRVTNIEPGMVETEFSEVRLGDKERAKSVYRGMKPLTAEDVAESVLWCLERPAHVNVQELVLFPTDQAAVQQVYRRDALKPS